MSNIGGALPPQSEFGGAGAPPVPPAPTPLNEFKPNITCVCGNILSGVTSEGCSCTLKVCNKCFNAHFVLTLIGQMSCDQQ